MYATARFVKRTDKLIGRITDRIPWQLIGVIQLHEMEILVHWMVAGQAS